MNSNSEFARGWPILIAASLGCAAGLFALPFYSLSSFMVPLETEFGWTRTQVGMASTCLTIGISATAPFVGYAVDKFGVRGVAIPSNIAFVICLALMATIGPNIWIFYGLYLLMSVVGAGTTPIGYTAAVATWFEKNRGLAFGITLAGTGLTGFLAPQILNNVIGEHGWRAGWLTLAAIAACTIPLTWLFIKKREVEHTTQSNVKDITGITLGQALKTRQLWFICIAFFALSLGISGLIINMVPLLSDAGLTREAAARTAGNIGLGVIFARLTIGFLVDRFFAPYIATVVFVITAAGCFLLAMGDIAYAAVGALLIGFAMGAEVDLIAFMTAKYFGLRHFGAIFGFGVASFNAGAILSPILVGLTYEHFSSYTQPLLVTVSLCGLAGGLILTLGRYPHLESDAESIGVENLAM